MKIDYIKEPVVKPLIKRKFPASLTKDITKLSTFRILLFVYNRHKLGITQCVVVVSWLWALSVNL